MFDRAIEPFTQLLTEHGELDVVLSHLKARGFSPMEAHVAMHVVLGKSHDDCKTILSESPEWSGCIDLADQLIDGNN